MDGKRCCLLLNSKISLMCSTLGRELSADSWLTTPFAFFWSELFWLSPSSWWLLLVSVVEDSWGSIELTVLFDSEPALRPCTKTASLRRLCASITFSCMSSLLENHRCETIKHYTGGVTDGFSKLMHHHCQLHNPSLSCSCRFSVMFSWTNEASELEKVMQTQYKINMTTAAWKTSACDCRGTYACSIFRRLFVTLTLIGHSTSFQLSVLSCCGW